MTTKPWRNTIDALVTTMIGSLLGMNIVMGSGALLLTIIDGQYSVWLIALGVTFFAWCLVTEVWVGITLWSRFLTHQHPFAVAVAMRQPLMPVLVRPLSSLWWFFHFAQVLVWGIVLTIAEKDMPFIGTLAVAGATTALSYPAFVYLMLAITAWTKDQQQVARIWRWRGPWAIAHGMIVVGARYFLAPHVNIN
jgi:hypothetical protein